jgi:molecular chaperone IbpA
MSPNLLNELSAAPPLGAKIGSERVLIPRLANPTWEVSGRLSGAPTKSPARPMAGHQCRFLRRTPMRAEYAPFYRSTIGFDHLFNLLDAATKTDTGSYPPYDIESVGENHYRITMAVAGFGESELDVEVRDNLLVVKGNKTETEESQSRFLYHGIAARGFERRFQLADHVAVTGAKLEKGLLHVELKREIPEALKPRRIEIGGERRVVENQAA